MRMHKRKLSSCQSFGCLKSKHQMVETEGTGFLSGHLLLSLVLLARKRIHLDLKCLMDCNVRLIFLIQINHFQEKLLILKP